MNDNSINPKTEFTEEEKICFYGSGYTDDSVTVSLDSDEESYDILNVEVSNGIVSTLTNAIKNIFSNIAGGVYRLVVSTGNKDIEYAEDVVVLDSNGEDEQYPENFDENIEAVEAPEFTTIGAALTLAGAGYYIHRKRKQWEKQ